MTCVRSRPTRARSARSWPSCSTTPGLKQDELETSLTGLIERQQLDVTRAGDLDPPGPVTPESEYANDSLEMRVIGLQGMLNVFKSTKASKDATAAGQLLSEQGLRLTSSDVVWDDFFRKPAELVLEEHDVDGVAVPDSNFVENAELYSARSMSAIWQRIHGASTGGTQTGAHGSSLAYVRAQPSGQTLSLTTETTIQVSTDLGFEVGVTNSGDFQEVSVKVTLDDPQGALADRQDGDDRPDRPGNDEDGDFPRLRRGSDR